MAPPAGQAREGEAEHEQREREIGHVLCIGSESAIDYPPGDTSRVDVEAIKNRQRRFWDLPEYSILARIIEPAAHGLCDACAVSAGQEVLDVAAGDGNFALACAREGARVVASDLAPGMVELGRRRSEAEGYEVEWLEADAEDLPFEDGRYDCVGSVFGAMLAPRPERVAGELFRVTRPGGTVGMTAWAPGSFSAELMAVGRRYLPPPSDMPSPEEWGDAATARERFEGLAARVEVERRSVLFEGGSAEELRARLERAAPIQVAARQALPDDEYAAMGREMREVFERFGAGPGPVAIESEYLLIVARKRG
jgi:SAM-dependent methyltransferase